MDTLTSLTTYVCVEFRAENR